MTTTAKPKRIRKPKAAPNEMQAKETKPKREHFTLAAKDLVRLTNAWFNNGGKEHQATFFAAALEQYPGFKTVDAIKAKWIRLGLLAPIPKRYALDAHDIVIARTAALKLLQYIGIDDEDPNTFSARSIAFARRAIEEVRFILREKGGPQAAEIDEPADEDLTERDYEPTQADIEEASESEEPTDEELWARERQPQFDERDEHQV